MFKVVGSYTDHEYGYGGWTGKTTEITEVVATFDCKKDACRYIKDCQLKNTTCWTGRPFRKRSLLASFRYAEVEEIVEEDPPPHNPVAPK